MSRTPPAPHYASADPFASASRRARASQRSRQRRRRRTIVVILMVIAVILVGADLIRRGMGFDLRKAATAGPELTSTPGPLPTSAAAPTPSAPPPTTSAAPVLSMPGAFPQSGPGTWDYANTQGAVLGTAGSLRRFRVAIETGVPQDMAEFTAKLDKTLGDPRSWTGGRTMRLQRVPRTSSAEFTVYLATPSTARKMCSAVFVDITVNGVPYTSCRGPGKVILNLARWRLSVPDYVSRGVPLEQYREYMINHESGHQFGFGHELCPGAGRPAPVMQTQTLGLKGCVANSWPYLNGKRYAGPTASS